MNHKIKTQPCQSPQSPFMRKPSRQLLKKLNFKKSKQNKLLSYETQQCQAAQNINYVSQKYQHAGSTLKLKKTTIELSTFKIMHLNTVLISQIQQLKKINKQLASQNQKLELQNTRLRQFNNLESNQEDIKCHQTPILNSFSQNRKISCDQKRQKQNNINFYNKRTNNKSLLQLSSNGNAIFAFKSNNLKTFSSCRTLFQNDQKQIQIFSQCEGSRIKQISLSRQTSISFSNQLQENQKSKMITNLNNQVSEFKQKIDLLQQQIQKCKLRCNKLQTQNEALYLHIEMNKRKILQKDQKIKSYQNKEKIKKLFQLSSESDSYY